MIWPNPKSLALIASILLVFTANSFAKTKDEQVLVNKAIQAIDNCYHFAGEIGDQSDERNKEIEQALHNYCPKAEALAKQAFLKYPNNTRLFEPLLNLAEIDLFRFSPEEKHKLCALHLENAFCNVK